MDPCNYNPKDLENRKRAFLKKVRNSLSVIPKSIKERPWSPTVNDAAGNHYLQVLHDRKHTDQEIHKFINKRRFYKEMKYSSEPTAQELLKDDPGYHHFQNMMRSAELPKSFLDGIRRNTLMMKDYALTQGTTRSLMEAFECLGAQIQRLILDNNNMRDKEFASILVAIARLPKFSCIAYRNNEVGPDSLKCILELLEKHPPGNLRELSL